MGDARNWDIAVNIEKADTARDSMWDNCNRILLEIKKLEEILFE